MRHRQDATPDPTARVAVPWVVTQVRASGPYSIHVRFMDGLEGEVDLSRMILASTAGVFAALRDQSQFEAVHVTDGVVCWPGGLDIAPDAMYTELKARGRWSIPPFPHPRS